MPEPQLIWLPQAGPQADAWTCPADEIFYGGTRGGGKSDCLIGRQIRGAEKYGRQWAGLIVRRKYKDHGEMRRRIRELITLGLDAELIGGEQQVNYWRFKNGAVATLTAIQHLKQCDDWVGHQFTEISIDEAPTIPFISNMIDRLKGSLRSPHGIPCSMFLTGNPGGAGASMIKTMYIPEADGGDVPVGEGQVNRFEIDLKGGKTATFSRVFIRSTLWDNQILTDMDPGYESRLRSMHNKQLVDAWLGGLWNVFVGQAFNFSNRHTIDPIWPIPEHAQMYMTMDWGYGAPFSIGWWWVDADGRAIRCAEWYGWDKVTPNVGLRLTDQELAEGIISREVSLGIENRDMIRIAGPDCFSKKPDYKGGGQGPATSEVFDRFGLSLMPGDPKREIKIRQFRNRLQVPDDPKDLPMMVVYNTCKQFIRIIPSLCVDETTLEYLEEGQEDHPFDEACHIAVARPLEMQIPANLPSSAEIDFMIAKGQMDKVKEYDEEMDRRISPEMHGDLGDPEEVAFNLED